MRHRASTPIRFALAWRGSAQGRAMGLALRTRMLDNALPGIASPTKTADR